MDAPRIQYAKTSDGVSIAYWTLGQGLPLLALPYFHAVYGDLEREWRIPAARAWYERLAAHHLVLRFDGRGVGLSQRHTVPYAASDTSRDMEAVLKACGISEFAVFAEQGAVGLALRFAKDFPSRVTRLVALSPVLDLSDFDRRSSWSGTRLVAQLDWHAYSSIVAGVQGVHDPESARLFAEMIRETGSFEHYAILFSAALAAPRVEIPPNIRVLVLHHRGSPHVYEELAREFAASIDGARVRFFDGNALVAWAGDLDALLGEIDDFLAPDAERDAAKDAGRHSDASPIRTILFTDIQDHTAMMQRLGDTKGRDVLREHERITREALRAHGGTEVKTIGDSFMASFPSAQRAVECAIALQRAFAAHSSGVGAQHAAPLPGPVEPIRVRIGLNAGEPIADEDDLFGSSVILAARTKEKAAGGEILVTEVVRHLVTGKGFSFADRGAIDMKGFEDPVRLYEVRWREEA